MGEVSRSVLRSLERAKAWRRQAERLRQMADAFEGEARDEVEELARQWESYAEWATRMLGEGRGKTG